MVWGWRLMEQCKELRSVCCFIDHKRRESRHWNEHTPTHTHTQWQAKNKSGQTPTLRFRSDISKQILFLQRTVRHGNFCKVLNNALTLFRDLFVHAGGHVLIRACSLMQGWLFFIHSLGWTVMTFGTDIHSLQEQQWPLKVFTHSVKYFSFLSARWPGTKSCSDFHGQTLCSDFGDSEGLHLLAWKWDTEGHWKKTGESPSCVYQTLPHQEVFQQCLS